MSNRQETRNDPGTNNIPERAIPGKRLKWQWVAALVLCILALAVYVFLARSGKAQSGAGKKGGGAAARTISVAAVPAKKGDVAVYLAGLGMVRVHGCVCGAHS